MKKLIRFLLLSFLVSSCSPKEYELESIEIMTYYYAYNHNKLTLDLSDYSKIDEAGNVETIKKVQRHEFNHTFYLKSKIDSKIIAKISENNKFKDDEFYKPKKDTNSFGLYCGPIIRVRTIYKNNKILNLTYRRHEPEPRYSLFTKMQNAILSNYINEKYHVIDSTNIKRSQKEFEKFAMKIDTLTFPMPPKSVTEEIKFPPPNK